MLYHQVFYCSPAPAVGFFTVLPWDVLLFTIRCSTVFFLLLHHQMFYFLTMRCSIVSPLDVPLVHHDCSTVSPSDVLLFHHVCSTVRPSDGLRFHDLYSTVPHDCSSVPPWDVLLFLHHFSTFPRWLFFCFTIRCSTVAPSHFHCSTFDS